MASSTSCVMKKQVFLSLLPGLQQLALELGAGLGVECAEGLIHEQHLGVGGVGAGNRDALLHAAGELLRVVVGELREVDLLQVLHRQLVGFLTLDAAHLEREADVLLDGQPGEERVLLEHDAAVCAGALHELAVAVDLAAGGLEQAGDDVRAACSCRSRRGRRRR